MSFPNVLQLLLPTLVPICVGYAVARWVGVSMQPIGALLRTVFVPAILFTALQERMQLHTFMLLVVIGAAAPPGPRPASQAPPVRSSWPTGGHRPPALVLHLTNRLVAGPGHFGEKECSLGDFHPGEDSDSARHERSGDGREERHVGQAQDIGDDQIGRPGQRGEIRGVTFQEAVILAEGAFGTLGTTGSYTPPRPPARYKGGGVGPSPTYSYTACVLEVDVDPKTGWIHVPKVWIAAAVRFGLERKGIRCQDLLRCHRDRPGRDGERPEMRRTAPGRP